MATPSTAALLVPSGRKARTAIAVRPSDFVGEVIGTAQGNRANLRYTLNLPIAGGLRRVAFDDWLYLQADGLILEHAALRIWGIRVGTVSAVIAPVHHAQDRLSALFGG